MIKYPQLRPIPSFLLPFTQASTSIHVRQLQSIAALRIPPPTPFVPDTQTFLTLIGRNLSQHATKIPSWEALFSLSSTQLKDLGVEPPRSRRYLLRWREKFRQGVYGVGGDVKHVFDGTAIVRAVEASTKTSIRDMATLTPWKERMVVVSSGSAWGGRTGVGQRPAPVRGLAIKGARTIVGPHVQPIKGAKGAARIVVKEGLWEDRRGRKIDGGERRQAEVRAKKRGEERRAAREKAA